MSNEDKIDVDYTMPPNMKSVAQIITHAEPYEISTNVICKFSAAGVAQPEASVKITRHMEDEETICDMVRADLTYGVDEVMLAVKAMFNKHNEVIVRT